MLSVTNKHFVLGVVMRNVVILGVVMLNVLAPKNYEFVLMRPHKNLSD